ncbi:hypothetical protein GPJ56_008311 [Histomonas meleagridis]|uniref:uncharacterized protein n=1 Tax=Histomonas meleagridis TaxID=135588 RepID=UPI00355A7864|nr:hypothetical protein GPJ56_008311 [Histomonas meleagridis]KAH0806882.1 hypothetical protein GO595_000058 [Histomonas meleagridis]
MNLFASRKDILCQEMTNTYNALVQASNFRKAYAKSWSDFGSTACAMMASQIPELKHQFEEMRKLFNDVAEIHVRLAEGELRNAEDFRDVIERFAVAFRANEESYNYKEVYKMARRKYQSLLDKKKQLESKTGGEKELPKVNVQIEDQKHVVIKAINAYIKKVKFLREAKDKYNKFKIRRMKHGWVRYTESLKKATDEEIAKFTEIQDLLSSLKVIDPKAGEAAEAMVAQQMSVSPPEPVQMPNAPDLPEEEKENEQDEQEEEKEDKESDEEIVEEQQQETINGNMNEPLFDDFE